MTLEIKRLQNYSRGELLLKAFLGAFYIAIPHIFVMYFVAIYVGILQFLTFWVILFTGKIPENWFKTFVNFQSWQLRFGASMGNMIEGYPEIGLSGSHPNVIFSVNYPQSVSRGSALLRAMFGFFYVLLPHAFVLGFRQIATGFLQMLAFWAILFTGSYPESWFNFNVGTLRWGNRVGLYMMNMEAEYPPFSGKSDQELGRDTAQTSGQEENMF